MKLLTASSTTTLPYVGQKTISEVTCYFEEVEIVIYPSQLARRARIVLRVENEIRIGNKVFQWISCFDELSKNQTIGQVKRRKINPTTLEPTKFVFEPFYLTNWVFQYPCSKCFLSRALTYVELFRLSRGPGNIPRSWGMVTWKQNVITTCCLLASTTMLVQRQ